MSLTTEFVPLELDQLRREASLMKADGWRFIQTHAVNTDNGIDLYYSFMKNGHVVNYWIAGVQKGTPVPSITDLFLAAFVFENEARELFGVDMRDIVLDFSGAMYAPAEREPMTFITPEQKAAREKARKAATAKVEKADEKPAVSEAKAVESAPAKTGGAASGKRVFVMTPERQARLDAKWPSLSDEKRAKVEAALKARAAEAEAATQTPQPADDAPKAAAPSALPANEPVANDAAPTADVFVDEQVDALINTMDDAKAAVIRAALAAKGGE